MENLKKYNRIKKLYSLAEKLERKIHSTILLIENRIQQTIEEINKEEPLPF